MEEYIHLVQWIPNGEVIKAFKDPAAAEKMKDAFNNNRTWRHKLQEAMIMKRIAYKVVKVEVV